MSNQHPIAVTGIGMVLPDQKPTPLTLPHDLGDPVLAFRCDAAPGKGILPSKALRRLGRAQRLAMTATHLALEDAGIDIDDRDRVALCVGTAWGELGHTYAFLENMIALDEQNPKPASFVNSVHNAIAGQIAIALKCTGENHTTIHSSISFENALWQAWRILHTNRADTVVVCAVDELNGYIVAAEQAAGRIPLDDVQANSDGIAPPHIIPGEGAVAVVLTRSSKSDEEVYLHHVRSRPWSGTDPLKFLTNSLEAFQFDPKQIDLMVCNMNGDSVQTSSYREVAYALSESTDHRVPLASFQHGTGDYRTSIAAGFAFAVDSIRNGRPSPSLRCESVTAPINTVLLHALYPTGYQSVCVLGQ